MEKNTTNIGTEKVKGAFLESLVRNNNQIREDRALNISEDAQFHYGRMIEDIDMEIRNLKRDREYMLDLSPTDANSLILSSDFKAKDFVDKDLKIGLEIRNLEIKLEILEKRYNHLFGDK